LADTSPIFIIGPHPVRVALSYTLRTKNGRKGWIDNCGVIFTLWDALFCMKSPVVPIVYSIRKYCQLGTWTETCLGLSIGCWHIVGSSATGYSVAVMSGALPKDLSSSNAIQSNCYLSEYSICLAIVSYPEPFSCDRYHLMITVMQAVHQHAYYRCLLIGAYALRLVE
jgi:hypothetical protein